MKPLKLNKHFIGLIFILSFLSVNICKAQNSSLEFWPELDVWYRLTPAWRISSYIPVTKYYESKNRDLNIFLQADYAWGHTKHSMVMRLQDQNRAQTMKAWLVRVGAMEGRSLSDRGESYNEDMIYEEIHRRTPLKGKVLLSQRIRHDMRWLGEDNDFSNRLRYRLMFEKEFVSGGSSIVPFASVEPFWDSRYNKINRVRAIGGSTFSWGPRLAFEGNFTYQYDSKASVNNIYALNVILHIFLETARSRNSVK